MRVKTNFNKKTLLILVGVLVLVGFLYFSGFGSFRSNIRLGWVEHKNTDHWTARYSYLNGFCEGKLTTTESPDVLHVEIDTEKGSVQIEIKNADGNFVFSKEVIDTSSFDVEVPGSAMIRITADGHKGGFDIGW